MYINNSNPILQFALEFKLKLISYAAHQTNRNARKANMDAFESIFAYKFKMKF